MPFITTDGRAEDDSAGQQGASLHDASACAGEESEGAQGSRRSSALGRAAKIVAACAGVAGLATCALAWKGSSSHPSLRSEGAKGVVSLAQDNMFDCYAEVQNWRNAWSEHQMEYCCLHAHVGCADEKPQQIAGSEVMQLDDIQQFPVTVDAQSFDCAQGFRNWQEGWPDEKKKWCCTNYELGCSDSKNYLGWLIMITVTLLIAGGASVLICLVVRKRGREEELKSRWKQFESQDKSRRCCTGMFEKENDSFASWFRPAEEKRGDCSSCCGDRDRPNKW